MSVVEGGQCFGLFVGLLTSPHPLRHHLFTQDVVALAVTQASFTFLQNPYTTSPSSASHFLPSHLSLDFFPKASSPPLLIIKLAI